MKKLLLTATLAGLTTLSLPGSLEAAQIVHTGLDWSRAMSIEIEKDGSIRQASAGVGQLIVDGGVSLLDAFCVNLFQGISLNQTYEAVTVTAAGFDAADGAEAAWLMRTFLPAVNAASGLARQQAGAALQLAIWDMIHDGGDGFTAGRVRATTNTNAAVLALADAWRLDGLGESAQANVYTAAWGTQVFQQQIFINTTTTPDGGDVPEPGTMAMAVAGVAGMWLARRRRG